MKTKTQKKMKKPLTSNSISSIDLEEHIKLDSIDKDVESVINKYTKDRKNVSAYSKDVKKNKGFFLMWVKKDLDAPHNEQIKITTFAQFINMDEIVNAMEKTISDMVTEQNKPVGIA